METQHHNYSRFFVRIDCNIFAPPSPPKKEKIFRFNSDFLLLTIFFNWSTKGLLLILIIYCRFVCLFYTACVSMIFIAGLWHLIITVSSLHVAISRFCWPVSVAIITDALRACRWFRSFAHNLPTRVCNYDRVENRAIRRKRPWARKVGAGTSCKKERTHRVQNGPWSIFGTEIEINSYTTRLYSWNKTWIQNWELA